MTGTMPLVERLTIAGFVAPRLRSGAFPRKIKVLDESGVVTREITGEDLGKALLKRVDIECSAPVPPTVCPKCGGKKTEKARMCRRCDKAVVVSREDIARAVSMYTSGMGARDVAKEIGISRDVLIRLFREEGVAFRRIGDPVTWSNAKKRNWNECSVPCPKGCGRMRVRIGVEMCGRCMQNVRMRRKRATARAAKKAQP